MKGYAGKILEVDLKKGKKKNKKLSDEDVNKFIGGTGLASKILLENVQKGTHPLSEENYLIFMTGPYTATKIPTSGRHAVVFKSPLTNTWGEADVGGSFGYSLKKSGYDGIVVKGSSKDLVYVLIDGKSVRIENAKDLKGKDTYETDKILKEKHGENVSIACIGPGGENLIRFASIMHDGKHGRAAGRGGSGAVMGSKNLKAIVVKPGNKKIDVANSKELTEIIKSFSKELVEKTKRMNLYGTDGGIEGFEAIADVPIKNWAEDKFDVEKISGPYMAETILAGKYGCKSCIIRCGREVKVDKYGVDGAGPEYETVSVFGPNCMIDDLNAISYANELCNKAGIDTITTGSLIAYCMEAYEKGLITKKDLGFELKWGDAEAMIKLLEKIINRKGLGFAIGLGLKEFSKQIDGEDFAIHVKGLDFPGHDPRASVNDFSYGNTNFLSYATSFRGACHLQSFSHTVDLKCLPFPEIGLKAENLTNEERAITVAKMQDYSALYDSLKFCKFTMFGGVQPGTVLALYNAVTGNDVSLEEFMKVGERICNMKHLFNVKEGFTKDDDKLPERILTTARRNGSSEDFKKNFKEMLDHYYEHREWDSKKNLKKKLRSLGIMDYY